MKRRERRAGGCERSIAAECILDRSEEWTKPSFWFRRNPSPFAFANFHFVVNDNCDGDLESV